MCPIVPSGGWVDGPITFETEGVWAREAREARTQSATLVEPMRLHAVARESRARPTLSALTHADVCTTNQSVIGVQLLAEVVMRLIGTDHLEIALAGPVTFRWSLTASTPQCSLCLPRSLPLFGVDASGHRPHRKLSPLT
jgi:hypothetical protein